MIAIDTDGLDGCGCIELAEHLQERREERENP